MKWVAMVLFLTGSPIRALAATDYCSDVRLDEGGSMEHVVVHNQLYIGDCYAHAGAQMFDAWRFLHGDTRYELQSSGFEMNQRFKIFNGERDINGGHLSQVLSEVAKQGSCDEKSLEKMFKGITVDDYASSVMGIYDLEKTGYHQYFENLKKTNHLPKASAIVDREVVDGVAIDSSENLKILDSFVQDGIRKLIAYHEKVLNIPFDYPRLSSIVNNLNTTEVFDKIGIIECSDSRIQGPSISTVNHNIYRTLNKVLTALDLESPVPESLRDIHAELDRPLNQAMPIGIGYCSKILKEGKQYQYQGSDDAICDRHASLVIGRRRNQKSGACELLVRNSWGDPCKKVDLHNKPIYSPDWECEAGRGTVWIDEKNLNDAIFETIVVRH